MPTLKKPMEPTRNLMTILGEEEEALPYHWDDMPEFNSHKKEPFATLKVHFRNEEDLMKFAEMVNQSLTRKTRSIWYPALEKSYKGLAFYVDEDDADHAEDFVLSDEELNEIEQGEEDIKEGEENI